MALYELRTYTLYVGKMAEAVKLYQRIDVPVHTDITIRSKRWLKDAPL